jgi:hypothetical protein
MHQNTLARLSRSSEVQLEIDGKFCDSSAQLTPQTPKNLYFISPSGT